MQPRRIGKWECAEELPQLHQRALGIVLGRLIGDGDIGDVVAPQSRARIVAARDCGCCRRR